MNTSHQPVLAGRARWVWQWVKHTFFDMKREWSEDGITDLAAATSFFSILSIPAATLAFVAALGPLEGLLGAGLAEDARTSISEYVASTFNSATLTDTVDGLFDNQRSSLLTLSLLVALVSVTRGFAGLVRALDVAYDLDHHRSWFDTRLTGLVMGLSTLGFAGLMLWFTYGLWPAVGSHVLIEWTGRVIVAVALVGWAAAIFHVGPNHTTPWKYDIAGAIITALSWFALIRGFAIYVSISGGGNGAVGAAGGTLLAFTLVYLLNVSLLVGAELNAILTQRAGVAQPPRRLHHRVTRRTKPT